MNDFDRTSVLERVRTALVGTTLAGAAGLVMAMTSPGTCVSGSVQGCDEVTSDVIATILSNPDKVSLGNLISYSIKITHYPNSGEQLHSTKLTLTTVPDQAGSSAIFKSLLPNSPIPPVQCTGLGTTTLSCDLGDSSAADQPITDFSVTVTAPASGSNVSLASTVSYFEDGQTEIAIFPSVDTVLSDPALHPDFVQTFVPPAGATFFTGTNDGQPSPGNGKTWAAKVTVSKSLNGVAGTVQNAINGDPYCPRAANLLDCSSSEITVPGFFPNELTFVLRRDASTIIGNGKIANAIVYYDPTGHVGAGGINYASYQFQVPACTDTTYGTLPKAGIPCVQERNAWFQYKDGAKAKDDGHGSSTGNDKNSKLLYWEFMIRAVDNGRFTN